MSDEILLLGAVAVAGYYAYQSMTQQSGDDSYSLGGGSGYISEVVKKADRMPAIEKKETPQVPQIVIKESYPEMPISKADLEQISRSKSIKSSPKKYSSSSSRASLSEIKEYAQKSDKYKVVSEGKKYVALEKKDSDKAKDYVLVVDESATVSDVVSAIGDIAKVDDKKEENPKKYAQKPKEEDKGIIDTIVDWFKGWF